MSPSSDFVNPSLYLAVIPDCRSDLRPVPSALSPAALASWRGQAAARVPPTWTTPPGRSSETPRPMRRRSSWGLPERVTEHRDWTERFLQVWHSDNTFSSPQSQLLCGFCSAKVMRTFECRPRAPREDKEALLNNPLLFPEVKFQPWLVHVWCLPLYHGRRKQEEHCVTTVRYKKYCHDILYSKTIMIFFILRKKMYFW